MLYTPNHPLLRLERQMRLITLYAFRLGSKKRPARARRGSAALDPGRAKRKNHAPRARRSGLAS